MDTELPYSQEDLKRMYGLLIEIMGRHGNNPKKVEGVEQCLHNILFTPDWHTW